MTPNISHHPSSFPRNFQEVPKNLHTLPWHHRFRLKLAFWGLAATALALPSCKRGEPALLDMNQRIAQLDTTRDSNLQRFEWQNQDTFFSIQSSLQQSYVRFSQQPDLEDLEGVLDDSTRNPLHISANVYFEARPTNSFSLKKEFLFIGFDHEKNRVISVTGNEKQIRASTLLTDENKKEAFSRMNDRIDQAIENKKTKE